MQEVPNVLLLFDCQRRVGAEAIEEGAIGDVRRG